MKLRSLILTSLMILACSAVSVPAQTPEALVTELYKLHANRSIAGWTRVQLRKYFTAELAGEIWRAAHSENGLDADLLYDAQDAQITKFKVTRQEPRTAVAAFTHVSFTNMGEKKQFVFEFAAIKPRGWRISELYYGGVVDSEHSLTNLLQSYR